MYRSAITELDEQALQEVFHTNVIAAMMLTGLCTPHLAERQGSGRLRGFYSHSARLPWRITLRCNQGRCAGPDSRAGSGARRTEDSRGCLLPGAVFTEINQRAGLMDDETALQRLQGMSDLHALGRIGTTEEIAEAMAYLICAEWVTGAMIDIDGGLGLGITADPAITNRKEQ